MRHLVRILAAALVLPLALLPAPAALAAGGSAKAGSVPAPVFLRLEPVIVNTMDGHRLAGLFTMTVTLQVPDDPARERLEAQRARLQDLMTRAAFSFAATQLDLRRPIPWQALTAHVQALTSAAYPAEKARVLIVDASTREF